MINEQFSLGDFLQEEGYDEEDSEHCKKILCLLSCIGQQIGHVNVAQIIGTAHFLYLTALQNEGLIGLTDKDGFETSVIEFAASFAETILKNVAAIKKERETNDDK